MTLLFVYVEAPEETYDPRSLFERLQEQKNKRDAEYEEAHKLSKLDFVQRKTILESISKKQKYFFLLKSHILRIRGNRFFNSQRQKFYLCLTTQ